VGRHRALRSHHPDPWRRACGLDRPGTTCDNTANNGQDAAGVTRTIELSTLAETEALARAMAPRLRAGDALGLSGPLGAGKTAFARALIGTRLAALGRVEEVPSTSYTLVQTYDLGDVELWHADLYRLGDASELAELGLDDAFAAAVTVVEWPERLGRLRPARRLDLDLAFRTGRGEEARTLRLAPQGCGWGWLDTILPAPADAS
jgi:tRNA threonylcarbamoyladenosine biosynthesis protein TsaE